MKENEAVDNERIVIDNVNEVKSKTSIQKYYFEKVQSMTMEEIKLIIIH